jgi:metallo-beta-lactamase class B
MTPYGFALILAGLFGFQQQPTDVPMKPFHVIGNIYYVGTTDPSGKWRQDAVSYLITTPEGHILIDTQFEEQVPQIQENMEKLGFKYQDIKIILNSHAHADHMAGHVRMRDLTKAQVVVSEGDAPTFVDGGRSDFRNDEGRELWRPMTPSRIIKDGDKVTLGGVTLTAHLTPGHTKGATTWTMTTRDGGRDYNVVIVGGVRVQERVPMVNNRLYPQISEDFARSFAKLKTLPCDVFLGVHGNWFDLAGKARRREQGANPNPFINPDEYREYVASSERAYLDLLRSQGGR